MSQFLLIANPDFTNVPSWVNFKDVTNDSFFSTVAENVFGDLNVETLVMPEVDDKDFDQIFVNAQRELIIGREFEDSLLHKFIVAIASNVSGMAFWYGDDFNDLNVVSDVKLLLNSVMEGLLSPSVELYVLYINERP